MFRRNAKKLDLFPAATPMDFVAIDVWKMMTTSRSSRYLLVITDRYQKLVRTVPLKWKEALEMGQALLRHCVLTYGPPTVAFLRQREGVHDTILPICVCTFLVIESMFTTTYHPQANY